MPTTYKEGKVKKSRQQHRRERNTFPPAINGRARSLVTQSPISFLTLLAVSGVKCHYCCIPPPPQDYTNQTKQDGIIYYNNFAYANRLPVAEPGGGEVAVRGALQFADLLQRGVPEPERSIYVTIGVYGTFSLMVRALGKSPVSSFLVCFLCSAALGLPQGSGPASGGMS